VPQRLSGQACPARRFVGCRRLNFP
jgi:hypothetical protein